MPDLIIFYDPRSDLKSEDLTPLATDFSFFLSFFLLFATKYNLQNCKEIKENGEETQRNPKAYAAWASSTNVKLQCKDSFFCLCLNIFDASFAYESSGQWQNVAENLNIRKLRCFIVQ